MSDGTARNSRYISVWSALDAIGRQGIQVCGAVVLARILTPAEFGEFVLPAAIYAAVTIFADLGQSASLIQRRRSARLLYSSVFWLHLAAGALFSALTFSSVLVLIPQASAQILLVCAVLSGAMIFNALGLVPSVVLMKALDFRRLSIINLCSSVVGVTAGITVALTLGGPAAFAVQLLATTACASSAIFVLSKFRPGFRFSIGALLTVRGTSLLSLVTNGMHAVQSSAYIWAMAPIVSAQTMGVFSRAEGLRQMIMTVFDAAFSRTSLPRFVSHADRPDLLVEDARRTLRISALILAPMTLGLAAMSTPFTKVMFGDQWIDMAGYLTILAAAVSVLPFHVMNWNMLLALRKTRICFVIQICRTLLVVVTVVVASRFGALATALGILGMSFAATLLYAPLSRSMLGYGLGSQIFDTATAYASAIVMALIVRYLATNWDIAAGWLFVALPMAGAVIYVTVLFLLGERWPLDATRGGRHPPLSPGRR